MTTIGGAGSFPYDEAGVFLGEDGHYYYYDDFAYEPDAYDHAPGRRIDGITIVAVGLMLFIAISFWLDKDEDQVISAVALPANTGTVVEAAALPPPPAAAEQPEVEVTASDAAAVIAPYDDYILTQGLHGQSYGHLAIDIKAGEGAVIKSPIEGVVTELFTDGVGNPTLVIENDTYKVMMLHGVYTVAVGDAVKMGQAVGTESNLGNTRDGLGRSCRGRDCGYHTHLNIFDKRLGANVNPLEVLGIRLSR
ncbi:MAG TPA: M23 family metallopeptidase [Anaerolineae bacterium]